MLGMSDPLLDPNELGTYLKDPTIDVERAALMISYAQTACESVLSPLPDTAAWIVCRIAGRGYVSTSSARASQIAAGGSPFGASPGGGGGIFLTDDDEIDLQRLGGVGGAMFTIDMLPTDYVAPPSWGPSTEWDEPPL